MVYDIISAHVADVHDELKKLLSHLGDLPKAESVKEVKGPHEAVTALFTERLDHTARSAARATSSVIEELTNIDSNIRKSLDEITSIDGEIATGADKLEGQLQSDGAAGNDSSSGGGLSRGSYGPGGIQA